MALVPQAQLAGGNVVAVLGDEEASLLADPIKYLHTGLKTELSLRQLTMQHLIHPQFERAQFIRNMPVAVRVGKVLFLHSGLYPNALWPQFKLAVSQTAKMGRYDFLLEQTSLLKSEAWWKDETKKADLLRRLFINEIYSVVLGQDTRAFDLPFHVGVFQNGQFIKLNSGIGVDEGSKLGEAIIFPEPSGMNLMQRTPIISIDAAGIKHRLN
jgi:hypothetical protein